MDGCQAEEITTLKAIFNEVAQELYKQQSSLMKLRDRPQGQVPKEVLEDQGLVVDVLDLKHLVALNKYRIVKEAYAGQPNQALVDTLKALVIYIGVTCGRRSWRSLKQSISCCKSRVK